MRNEGLEAIGEFFLLCLASLVGVLVTGWSISILWGWFVVPLFGLPALKITTAYGLCLVFAAIKGASGDDTKRDPDKRAERVAVMLIYPVVLVGIGWVVRLFM